jgi:hypothetical protein
MIFFFGSFLVYLSARKQSSDAQSTTESEHIAAASYCSHIHWIVHAMRDYGVTYKSVPLMCDNFSAICLAQNPIFLWESKTHKSETSLLERPC